MYSGEKKKRTKRTFYKFAYSSFRTFSGQCGWIFNRSYSRKMHFFGSTEKLLTHTHTPKRLEVTEHGLIPSSFTVGVCVTCTPFHQDQICGICSCSRSTKEVITNSRLLLCLDVVLWSSWCCLIRYVHYQTLALSTNKSINSHIVWPQIVAGCT